MATMTRVYWQVRDLQGGTYAAPTGTVVQVSWPVPRVLDTTVPETVTMQTAQGTIDATGKLVDAASVEGLQVLDPNDTSVQPHGYTLTITVMPQDGRPAWTVYALLSTPRAGGGYDLAENVALETAGGALVVKGDPGPGLAPKGHVANAASRPATPTIGDAWVTDDDGHLSAWNGTTWIDMGQWRGDVGAGVPATAGAVVGDAIVYDGSTSAWGQVDWSKLKNKPAVIGAGADPAAARAAIGAGTSNLGLGATSATAMPGNKVATDLGGASATDGRFVGVPVTTQTGAYTLVATDAGSIVEVNSASAVNVTVPASTFTAGQIVEVCQLGAGQVTIVAGSGVTLRSAGGLKISAQYGSASIRFRSATEAVVSGSMST